VFLSVCFSKSLLVCFLLFAALSLLVFLLENRFFSGRPSGNEILVEKQFVVGFVLKLDEKYSSSG
jgi:hypothetical protein